MNSPAPPTLRAPAFSLDPAVQRVWAINAGVSALVVAIIAGIGLGIATAAGASPIWAWLGLGAIVILGVAAALVLPPVWYRFFRWEVTDLGLYVQEGWLWRSWTIVPHSRIQTVDTNSGPLERFFGLASVRVRTASGEGVTIPGLSEALVADLTTRLAEMAGEGDAT